MQYVSRNVPSLIGSLCIVKGIPSARETFSDFFLKGGMQRFFKGFIANCFSSPALWDSERTNVKGIESIAIKYPCSVFLIFKLSAVLYSVPESVFISAFKGYGFFSVKSLRALWRKVIFPDKIFKFSFLYFFLLQRLIMSSETTSVTTVDIRSGSIPDCARE